VVPVISVVLLYLTQVEELPVFVAVVGEAAPVVLQDL
jgi:hypothetical protein